MTANASGDDAQVALDLLLEEFFGEFFSESDRQGTVSSQEEEQVIWCFAYVKDRFASMKYILGTAIDFVLLAQCLRRHDENLARHDAMRSEESIFDRYTLIKQRGSRQSNTLTLKYETYQYGIRKLEERVLRYFVAQRRLGYPSAYVYNSGQWAKYKDLLVCVFQLSAYARFKLFCQLIDFGNQSIPVKNVRVIAKKDLGDFERFLTEYERSYEGENGGLAFQAMCYGFASVQFGHLSISASSVRTGSSRQQRFGDVDVYAGADLVVSIEVKDFEITSDNYENEVGGFISEVAATNVRGLVCCRACQAEVQEAVSKLAPTLRFVTDKDLLFATHLWDDQLHQKAVDGMLHFLANIEHNESAAKRAKEFLDL